MRVDALRRWAHYNYKLVFLTTKQLYNNKIYNIRTIPPHLLLAFSHHAVKILLDFSLLFRKPTFLKKKITSLYIQRFLISFFNNASVFNAVFKFKWFRFVLFSGLGYKRRFYNRQKTMFTYIGNRHWILYKLLTPSFIVPIKRRNFFFFSPSKNWFNSSYSFFSSLQKPYIYKMKGFLDSRVRQRFVFVRRIRLRGIKTKLSKKQQML